MTALRVGPVAFGACVEVDLLVVEDIEVLFCELFFVGFIRRIALARDGLHALALFSLVGLALLTLFM